MEKALLGTSGEESFRPIAKALMALQEQSSSSQEWNTIQRTTCINLLCLELAA